MLARAFVVVAHLRYREALSYRWLSGQALLAPLLEVGFLFFLSRLVPSDNTDLGVGYFEFSVVGVATMNLVSGCVQSAHQYFRSLQLTGLLDWYSSTPMDLVSLMLANAGTSLGLPLMRFGANLVLGFALGAELRLSVVRLAILVVAVCVAAAPLTLASQGWLLRFKKGDPIGLGISASALLFCGIYFPISVLPDAWQMVSLLIPTTHLAELARWCLGVKSVDFESALVALAVWGLLAGSVSMVAILQVAKHVRRSGQLADY